MIGLNPNQYMIYKSFGDLPTSTDNLSRRFSRIAAPLIFMLKTTSPVGPAIGVDDEEQDDKGIQMEN